MYTEDPGHDAVDLLQQLGLKEYEAKCFVALSQLATGTAKEVAEIADVPQTRVYDTVRLLEARGLVEVQHTSPQQFRTVRIDEAVETLQGQYESRIERLSDALEQTREGRTRSTAENQEVWSLVGADAIRNRVERLVGAADDRVVVIVGDEIRLTDELFDSLDSLDDVAVVVIVPTDEARRRVRNYAPAAETYVSAFDWLVDAGTDGVAVGTVLLVDGGRALVSTKLPNGEERAVIGTAPHNGLVVLVRRLTAFVTDQ